MAIWQIMFGMGLGLVVTILTVIVTQRDRSISHTPKSNFCSPPGENCSICLSGMTNDEMAYMNCGHAVHEPCLKELRRHREKKCPICRRDI